MGIRKAIILSLVVLLLSCEKEDPVLKKGSEFEILTDTALIQTVTPASIRLLLSVSGYSQFKDYFKYRSAIYRVEYETTYNGKPIIASGLICLPVDMPQPWPVLNIFHGLVFADREAPSSFNLPNNFIGYEFISSIGFAVFIPDLIGYGVTKDTTFGIYNKKVISIPSVDMIRAGVEFLKANNMAYSDLYLGGYSLGGYDAITTLEYIDNNNIDLGIPVSGAVIGAGGYNLHKVMKTNIMKEAYPSPAQLILLLYSYNELNGWNRPLNHYFQDDIAGQVPQLLSGAYSSDEINARLPTEFDRILTPEYLEIMRNDQDTLLVNALKANSVNAWIPQYPTRLYHSMDDEKIPYSDSEELFLHITKNSTIDIELVDISGEDHFNAAPEYIERALTWLQTLINSN